MTASAASTHSARQDERRRSSRGLVMRVLRLALIGAAVFVFLWLVGV